MRQQDIRKAPEGMDRSLRMHRDMMVVRAAARFPEEGRARGC